MVFRKSQLLAVLSVCRPDVNRLRYPWMRSPLDKWNDFMLACGAPGSSTSVEKIKALSRQAHAIDTTGVIRINTHIAGNAHGQPVIFIHGSPGSADGWADYLNTVPPHFRYIALDRPGFGRSGPEHAIISIAEQAKAVGDLLFEPSGPKPILVGHSMGGPIAAWVAATMPDAISGVIILAGSLDPSQEQIHPLQYVGASRPIERLLPRAVRNANRELMALKTELEKLQPLLGKIRVPVLIMHGTRDDLVPYQNVDYMRAHLTGSKHVVVKRLDGFNHFLPWNAKTHIEAAIAELADGF